MKRYVVGGKKTRHTSAEARRLGELEGSRMAEGWIGRALEGLRGADRKDALETALVSQGYRDTMRDVARQKAISLFGAKVKRAQDTFVDGYVAYALKEFRREYGRVE